MNRFLILFASVIGLVFMAGSSSAAPEDCVTTVGCPGKLTIELDTNPERTDPDFQFRSAQVGDFTLEDTNLGRRVTFKFEEPEVVIITQDEPAGWNLDDIVCRKDHGNASVSVVNERLVVDIDLDEVVHCTFVNELSVTPTPTSTATAVPTNTVVPTATPVVATPGPSAEAIAALEAANAARAVADAIKNQPAPVVNQSVIVEAPRMPVGIISPPNTGSAGLAMGPCGWEYVQYYQPGYTSWHWTGWKWVSVWHPGHYYWEWEFVC